MSAFLRFGAQLQWLERNQKIADSDQGSAPTVTPDGSPERREQMAYPEAVQKQIDEGEALEAGLAQQEGDSGNATQPVVDSQVAPQPNLEQRIAELERDLNSARVEQGRVRALTQQLKTAQEQIEQLQEQAKKPPEPEPPKSNPQRDELVDQYGDELVTYMDQLAQGQSAKFQSEIDRIKGETGEVRKQQVQSAQERFWADLNSAHADWQTVQSSDAGQKFLLSPVPYDPQGRTFDDLLQEAAQTLNARVAIEVFTGLKDNTGNRATPQDRARSQVVPGKGPGGAPQPNKNKPTLTQAEIHRASLEYAKDQSLDLPRKYGAKTIDEWDTLVNEAAIEGRIH